MVKINIKDIISFYDDKNPIDSKQVSSITGLVGEDLAAGLLKHYFESIGKVVIVLDKYPTEKKDSEKKKAKHLDRWIKIATPQETIFYQIEIKSWCSHSFSGKKVDDKKIVEYAQKMFEGQWDYREKTLRHDYVSKVLKQMKSPEGYQAEDKIMPLVCYWFPVLPQGQTTISPFFCMRSNNSMFPIIYFFSASIYLRELSKTCTQINIEAPHIESRLKKIKQLYIEVDNEPFNKESSGNMN